MRLSLVVAALSVLSLAACESTPKAPATPVQANQASQGQSADQQAEQVRPRRKYCTTGSRLCSESVDPSVGDAPAGGLTNNTSNVPF
jgi:uncharacterized lipoprotein YbaY